MADNPAQTTQDERIPQLPTLPAGTDRATLTVPAYCPATNLTHQVPLSESAAVVAANVPVYSPTFNALGSPPGYPVGFLVRYTPPGGVEGYAYSKKAGQLPAPTFVSMDVNWRQTIKPVPAAQFVVTGTYAQLIQDLYANGNLPENRQLRISGRPDGLDIILWSIDRATLDLTRVFTLDASQQGAEAVRVDYDVTADTWTAHPSSDAVAQELHAHEEDTSNPHLVTAAQVGLGLVNNTRDADKPVSYYTQQALNNLQDSFTSNLNNESQSRLQADATTLSSAKAYTDQQVTSVYRPAGGWDASQGTFPTTGTGTNGGIRRGDTYNVTVAGSIGGHLYDIGDTFYANAPTPGQVASNWQRFEANTEQAQEGFRGTVAIATQAVVQNEATANDQDAVTPKKFWLGLARLQALARSISGLWTFTTSPLVPTAAAGTNNTQAANTAFVANAVAGLSTGGAAADTYATLGYASSLTPDFSQVDAWQIMTLTGDLTLPGTTGRPPGGSGSQPLKSKTLELRSDGTAHALTMSGASWKWLTAIPASLPAGQSGYLTLTCSGGSENNVTASYIATY